MIGDTSAVGRVLFLVGPSSAGKSSIGHQLLKLLPEPYLFFEADRFGGHYPHDRPEFVNAEQEDRLTHGAALALRGYLDAGVNLIVERDLCHPRNRALVARVFAPYRAWMIGLRWSPEALETREAERQDGIYPGTARHQAIGRHGVDLPYDLVVDAMYQSPQSSAESIVGWLTGDPQPTAIRALSTEAP